MSSPGIVDLSNRTLRISILFLVLWSIACTQIPLLNYLGFEFSALLTIPFGLASGFLFLASWKRDEPGTNRAFHRLVWRTILLSLIVSLFPLAILLANALVVRNCSLEDGFIYFLLLVPPAGIFSIALASLVASAMRRYVRTVFVVLFILILLQIAVATIARPQIFAFNLILGFFPGVTYDDSIRITNRLAMFRIVTILAATCIFALSSVVHWRRRKASSRDPHVVARTFPRLGFLLIAALGPALIIVYLMSDRIGFSSSESSIETRLAGVRHRPHVNMIFSAGSSTFAQANQMVDYNEFIFWHLSGQLELVHPEGVTTFVYSNADQKARLVGAGSTDISKPWLRQIHVNSSDVQSVLRHEMVHVLAADFGIPMIGISRNPGLIEGLAVALEGVAYDEPLDRAAALVRASGLRPELGRLFSVSGFMTSAQSVSYTYAGAFCQWLIRSYGMGSFKRLYRSGDFEEVTGKSFSDLERAWTSTIDTIALSADDSLKAAAIFRHPSIFKRECVRSMAAMNARTSLLLEERRFKEALISADRVLALSPNPDAVYQKSRALYESGQYREAADNAIAWLKDPELGPTLLPMRLRFGDALWALGQTDSAVQQYRLLMRTHLNSAYDAACALRLLALGAGSSSGMLWQVLTHSIPDQDRLKILAAVDLPVARYVEGGILLAAEDSRSALVRLNAAGVMPIRVLEYERLMRIGHAWLETGDPSSAEKSFQQAKKVARGAEIVDVEELIEQCAWRGIRTK